MVAVMAAAAAMTVTAGKAANATTVKSNCKNEYICCLISFSSYALNPCIPINGGKGNARHRVVEKETMEFYHPFWMLPSFGMG